MNDLILDTISYVADEKKYTIHDRVTVINKLLDIIRITPTNKEKDNA